METAAPITATPEELTSSQKWMWVIGLTGVLYVLIYKVNRL
jgi:hypothetical protein